MADTELSIEQRIHNLSAPPEEAPAEAPEAAEEAPEEQAAPEEAEEPSAEAAEEAGEEAEDVVEISSLADLTEHLGITADDLYALAVPATVNGKRADVTLSELKDSYVASAEAKRIQEEAKTLRESIQEQQRTSEERYKAQLAQAAALVEDLEKSALSRFEGVNWNELRQSDPSEWAALKTEYEQTRQALDARKRNVAQGIQQYQQQMQAQQKQALDQHLAKEREALMTAWPEMAGEKGEAVRTALVKDLKARGFSDAEIEGVSDHRVLLMARDAMRWRESASKTDAAKKKIVKIAKKTIRPGAKQTKDEQRTEALQPIRQRLKKTGDWKDAAELLSARSKMR